MKSVMQEAAARQQSPNGDECAATAQPEPAQSDVAMSGAGGVFEEAAPSAKDAAVAKDVAASPTGPMQLPAPPPPPASTAPESNGAAHSAVSSNPREAAKYEPGNVQISTEADALRAQAASQHGGLAAARALGDRLLGAPLRDSSQLVRSSLFSLVSSVARAPGSVLGRTASSGAASRSGSVAQSPAAAASGGLAPDPAASMASNAAVTSAVSRAESVGPSPTPSPAAGLEVVLATAPSASDQRSVIQIVISATADAGRPVRIAMSISAVARDGAAAASAAAAGAAPQAAEAYRPAARAGFGGWLGRGGGGAPPTPPSAVPTAADQPVSPPAAHVHRQLSLPSASERIGSFFRRGGAVTAPAPATDAGEASQPSAGRSPTPQHAAAEAKASGLEQANVQVTADNAAVEPHKMPARPINASAAGPAAERPALAAGPQPKLSVAALSAPPATSPLRGKPEPEERRKLRVAVQMAAQLRQVIT